MEFNTPELSFELQLDNIVKLLDAKIDRCRVYNSVNRDDVYHQITITYKDKS